MSQVNLMMTLSGHHPNLGSLRRNMTSLTSSFSWMIHGKKLRVYIYISSLQSKQFSTSMLRDWKAGYSHAEGRRDRSSKIHNFNKDQQGNSK